MILSNGNRQGQGGAMGRKRVIVAIFGRWRYVPRANHCRRDFIFRGNANKTPLEVRTTSFPIRNPIHWIQSSLRISYEFLCG